MNIFDALFFLVIALVCAFVAGKIHASKGRKYDDGFVIGFFLGIIGVIIVAILPVNEKGVEQGKLKDGTSKKCPYCSEIIKTEATVCRYCGRDLPAAIAPNK